MDVSRKTLKDMEDCFSDMEVAEEKCRYRGRRCLDPETATPQREGVFAFWASCERPVDSILKTESGERAELKELSVTSGILKTPDPVPFVPAVCF